MGKGSARRPTDEKAYASNWDAIFGKKKDEKPLQPRGIGSSQDSGLGEAGGQHSPLDNNNLVSLGIR
jgi:hypothetical protein